MKPRNTRVSKDNKIRKAIKSAIITICIRIAALFACFSLWRGREWGTLFTITLLGFMVAMAIQIVFMPYFTWRRVKEIEGGELDEASQY